MSPLVCQDAQSEPRSRGMCSIPEYSIVRNWFAAVLRQKKNASLVQKGLPGVFLSKDGIGVLRSFSICMFADDFDSTGSASPLWSTAPSKGATPFAKISPPRKFFLQAEPVLRDSADWYGFLATSLLKSSLNHPVFLAKYERERGGLPDQRVAHRGQPL